MIAGHKISKATALEGARTFLVTSEGMMGFGIRDMVLEKREIQLRRTQSMALC
jgi:hypothetical protein